ncbi:hypothetical protein [Promicromonospora sp. NPDC023987]|uniref:hypothetical protein n=1 Tax=Promicromonospora sp. NPDC023987 TaxID=3155360 RepID=UPI0033DBC75D
MLTTLARFEHFEIVTLGSSNTRMPEVNAMFTGWLKDWAAERDTTTTGSNVSRTPAMNRLPSNRRSCGPPQCITPAPTAEFTELSRVRVGASSSRTPGSPSLSKPRTRSLTPPIRSTVKTTQRSGADRATHGKQRSSPL